MLLTTVISWVVTEIMGLDTTEDSCCIFWSIVDDGEFNLFEFNPSFIAN
jgi:hypothetical protein